jgi:hypothetical protein
MIKTKRGAVDEKTGLVFWRRMKTAKNGEYWVTQEEFQRLTSKASKDGARWVSQNKEKSRRLNREFFLKNPGYAAKAKAKQRMLRPQEHKDYLKQWMKNNPDKVKAIRKRAQPRVNAWLRNRRKQNPIVALKNRIRARIAYCFQKLGKVKSPRTIEILGCEWSFLQKHIEKQFKQGMNWGNRGEWHIDHIIPLASAKTEQDVIRLCHYSNLQPLWASENQKKWHRMP